MSSDYLPTKSRSTYRQYICFAKLFINERKLLDLLKTVEEDRTTFKSLGTSHLHRAVLYIAKVRIVLPLVEATHFYIKIPTVFFSFNSTSIYATACDVISPS